MFFKEWVFVVAQALLFYRYSIPKHQLKDKIFGVYDIKINPARLRLMQGLLISSQCQYQGIQKQDMKT